MRLRHFGNSREIPFITADENYDPTYQQNFNLPQEIKLFHGDQLVTECVYNSTQAIKRINAIAIK